MNDDDLKKGLKVKFDFSFYFFMIPLNFNMEIRNWNTN